MSAPAASRRDRFGRRWYPVPHPETHEIHDLPSWTRLKNLLHSGGVETWKLKTVARTVARRADLQMLAADESNTYSAVQQCLDAARDKSNIGTAVHTYTEYIDNDCLDWEVVPPVMVPWLRKYIDARERYGWTMVETEATVYNLTVGYAGTADRFVNLPGYGIVVLDLKTGAEVWAETALQLAAYSGGEGLWLPPKDNELVEYSGKLAELERDIAAGENFKAWGSPRARKWSEAAKKLAYSTLDELYWDEFANHPGHRPMPEGLRTDIGFVVHLTDEVCELVPMTLDGEPSAHEAVKALCVIFGWQQREKDIVGRPLGSDDSADGAGDPGPADGPSDPAPEVRDPDPAPSQPPADPPARPKDEDGKTVKQFREQEPTADWVIQRILALPEGEPRDELAAQWPEGVPTFKETREHNVTQLWAIDDVLREIEAKHELAFVPRPVTLTEPPPLVDEADRARLVEMAMALPEAAAAAVTARKNEEGIPNLKSPRLTAEQAARFAQLIEEANNTHGGQQAA